jgi:4-hydroxy-tetrahydrodipicolinate synthase
VASPPFVRPSQEGLFRHFQALAAASNLPFVVYDIPYRAAVGLSVETLLRLAELPNVVGVKDCHADSGHTFELIRAKPESFSVMTGEDASYHAALTMGAEGAILASAHMATGQFAAIRERVGANDGEGALALWRELADLPRLLFAEPNPAPIKHWLWRAGLIASAEIRLPLTGISAGLAERLDAMRARMAAW